MLLTTRPTIPQIRCAQLLKLFKQTLLDVCSATSRVLGHQKTCTPRGQQPDGPCRGTVGDIGASGRPNYTLGALGGGPRTMQPPAGHGGRSMRVLEALFMRVIIIRSMSARSGVTGSPSADFPTTLRPGLQGIGTSMCGTCRHFHVRFKLL